MVITHFILWTIKKIFKNNRKELDKNNYIKNITTTGVVVYTAL